MKNRVRNAAYDAAAITEALAAPLELRTKPPVRKLDPASLPSMADYGIRPVTTPQKARVRVDQ